MALPNESTPVDTTDTAPVADAPAVEDVSDSSLPDENVFEELLADDTQVDDPVVEPGTAEGEGGAAEEIPAVSPEPAAQTPEAEPVPATPAAPEPQPVAAEPQPAQLTPEQQAQRSAEFQRQAIDTLATQVYALSEDDVAQIETNPAEAFPRLAAVVHMRTMAAATNYMMRMMPQVVSAITANTQNASAAEQQFFSQHAELTDHKDLVQRFGAAYRQVNPQASAEDFIRDVGAQVKVALGLHQQPAPAVAAAAAPHRPAGARAAAAAPTPAPSDNPFTVLAEEFLNSDM